MKTINLTDILERQIGKTRFSLMGFQEKQDIITAMKTSIGAVLELASENAKIGSLPLLPSSLDRLFIEVDKQSIINTMNQITQ